MELFNVLAVPITLSAVFAYLDQRFLGLPTTIGVRVSALLPRVRRFRPHAAKTMNRGGLRGGISVALALSLPPGRERQLIVPITCAVVAFSIPIRGLSVGALARRLPAP